jgi:hypothetical protein
MFLSIFVPSSDIHIVFLAIVQHRVSVQKGKFRIFSKKLSDKPDYFIVDISQQPYLTNQLGTACLKCLHLHMRLYLHITDWNDAFHLPLSFFYVLLVTSMKSNKSLLVSNIFFLFELFFNLLTTYKIQALKVVIVI